MFRYVCIPGNQITEGLSSWGYSFILRQQGSTLLIYYCHKSLTGMPSYLPFPEAQGRGRGTKCCGRLNRGYRATKEKANVRSRVRMADEKNYIAVEQKELREHKLMLIGSRQKGLLDLWYFLNNQYFDYLAERVIIKLFFNDRERVVFQLLENICSHWCMKLVRLPGGISPLP